MEAWTSVYLELYHHKMLNGFSSFKKRDCFFFVFFFECLQANRWKKRRASVFPHWFVETLIKLLCRQFVIPNHAITRFQPVLTSRHERSVLASASHTFADVVTQPDVGQREQRWPTMICLWDHWFLKPIGTIFIHTEEGFPSGYFW